MDLIQMLPAEQLLTEICKMGNVNKKYLYVLEGEYVKIHYFHKIWPDDKKPLKCDIGNLNIKNNQLVWDKKQHAFDIQNPKFNIKHVIEFIEHAHKPKV